MLSVLNKVGKEKCGENKVRVMKVNEKKYVDFTKKGNDSTIMEYTKWKNEIHYYRTEEVSNYEVHR